MTETLLLFSKEFNTMLTAALCQREYFCVTDKVPRTLDIILKTAHVLTSIFYKLETWKNKGKSRQQWWTRESDSTETNKVIQFQVTLHSISPNYGLIALHVI